ncbi:hypothetical protein BC629DRAFT_1624537 [Irpex lacteus]|nr:hypothetical protein BC629DRAFT_1624537 [Irpex lacteus]
MPIHAHALAMHDTAGSIDYVASFGPGNSRAHRGTLTAGETVGFAEVLTSRYRGPHAKASKEVNYNRPTSEHTSSSSRKPGPTILEPTHPRKAQIQPSGDPTFKRPYLLTHLGRGDSDAATTEKEMPNTILVAHGDRANSPSALTISPARVTEERNFERDLRAGNRLKVEPRLVL